MNFVRFVTLRTQGYSQIVITPIFPTQIYVNNSLTQRELFTGMKTHFFYQHDAGQSLHVSQRANQPHQAHAFKDEGRRIPHFDSN
jgi:hypothetical protein